MFFYDIKKITSHQRKLIRFYL